jgi:hypothetical protein
MNYEFEAEVHLWAANPKFFLVSVPPEFSAEIRQFSEGLTNGFGSLKVEAQIGSIVWRTSIFPESSTGIFDLPLKAEVRKKNQLVEGSLAQVKLEILGF